jgi:C4-dicarboxylate transporter DctM subunit
MITPPFGVNLFAACTVAKISLDRIIGTCCRLWA